MQKGRQAKTCLPFLHSLKHSVSLSHHIACRETLKELRTAEFFGLGRFFILHFLSKCFKRYVYLQTKPFTQ